MFNRWFDEKPKKIGFEDVKVAMQYPTQYLLINTLPAHEQVCLIKNTVPIDLEEKCMNDLLDKYELDKWTIVVYGKNGADISVDTKCKQLRSFGFSHVYIYGGGLFEWLLLQDIYGFSEFPSTSREIDILKYRPTKTFSNLLYLGR
jgi:hypothetical protein